MEKEILLFEKFDLPIKIHPLHIEKGGTYRGMHSHTALEIVEVKSGVLSCCINDGVTQVYPGQVLFINSNTGHRLYSENAEIIYLHFDAGLLEEQRNDEFRMLYRFISHVQVKPYQIFKDNQELTELLAKINLKYYEQSKESRWYVKAYLYELIAFMYAQSFIAPLQISEEKVKKIEQIAQYIEGNFKSPITLEEICIAANYNKNTICHTFKAVTGSTIFEYVNFLRVSFAAEQLWQTRKSILEIATECGFSSAAYFNRIFKNFFGCAPSVYRKLLQTPYIL